MTETDQTTFEMIAEPFSYMQIPCLCSKRLLTEQYKRSNSRSFFGSPGRALFWIKRNALKICCNVLFMIKVMQNMTFITNILLAAVGL